LIVDAQKTFGAALAVALCAQPDLSIADVAASGENAAAALDSDDADVLLIDLEMPGENGIEIVTKLRRKNSGLRVVVISDLQDPAVAVAAVQAGVNAWVPKRLGLRDLLGVIRGVQAGESWFPPALLGPVLADLAHPEPSPEAQKIASLTARERQILLYMVEGLDRQAIARVLYLSTNTVRTHIQNLLGKLDAHSGVEAIAIAVRAGMDRQERQEMTAG
jgi:DNA-binding NarL/FixJ family response regulator